MRDIKFRGKRVDNGEWVHGMLCKTFVNDELENGYGIQVADEFEMTSYPVDPSTVGQFTGFVDKNGIEVYEGDMLSTDLDRPYLIVVFRNGCFMVQCHDSGENYFDIMVPIEPKTNTVKHHAVIGSFLESEG